MPDKTKRRKLQLTDLNSVIAECQNLYAKGYEQHGNLTLGQICRHLATDIGCSVDGYPKWMALFAPLRPVVRSFMLPKILSFNSPVGIRTAAKFVPPEDLDDQLELENYKLQIQRFLTHTGKYCTHPGFGSQNREQFQRIYAAHASHHLRFLKPHD